MGLDWAWGWIWKWEGMMTEAVVRVVGSFIWVGLMVMVVLGLRVTFVYTHTP